MVVISSRFRASDGRAGATRRTATTSTTAAPHQPSRNAPIAPAATADAANSIGSDIADRPDRDPVCARRRGATGVLPHRSGDVLPELRLEEDAGPSPLAFGRRARRRMASQINAPAAVPAAASTTERDECAPFHPGELDVAAVPERAHPEGRRR